MPQVLTVLNTNTLGQNMKEEFRLHAALQMLSKLALDL